MNKIIAVILAFLLLLGNVNAQIAINSFSANPSTITPGSRVQVSIELENVGKQDIENIVVKLDLNQVPFAPVNSASEKVLEELGDGDSTIVVFDLIALPDAASQIYKIPVKISYENISKDSLISLSVAGQARLDVVLESSEIVKIGDNGKVIVKMINNGLTDLKFLTIKLANSNSYELLSTDTVYIGQVDVDDFETAEFTLLAREKNPEMFFTVSYRDSNNKDYSQNKIVRLNVYTLEEAKQLGLVTSNILGWVIGVVALLVIGFFVYRRIKRRRLKL